MVRTELIDRRILILYRVSTAALEQVLPAAAEPREVADRALAGIAFRRRRTMRSGWVPAQLGTSQCATHFVLLRKCRGAGCHPGVVALRHDCSSRWQAWWSSAGRSHHARFEVADYVDSLELAGDSDDRVMQLRFKAHPARGLPYRSIFRSIPQVTDYLADDLAGLGLLQSRQVAEESSGGWAHLRLEPLEVAQLESSIFDRWRQASPGLVEFDSAFSLREDQLAWSQEGTLCCHVVPA